MATAVIQGAPGSGAVIRVHVCSGRRTSAPRSSQEPGTLPPCNPQVRSTEGPACHRAVVSMSAQPPAAPRPGHTALML